MLSQSTVLIWLLLMPPTGVLLSLAGAAVMRALPATAREEAAPAPDYLASGICVLCLALEVALFARGHPAAADFRWTPDFAQLRLLLDRQGALSLSVVTVAGLAAVAWQARLASRDALTRACRQAPVMLSLTAALVAIAAADAYLMILALGSALALAWWAAAQHGSHEERHQGWSLQGVGLAAVVAGVMLLCVTARESHLPSLSLAVWSAPRASVRAALLLLALGLAVMTGAIPGISWWRHESRPACYGPVLVAAVALLARLPLQAAPHPVLASFRPLLPLVVLAAAWWPLRVTLAPRHAQAEHLGAVSAAALALAGAIAGWFVPATAVPRLAAGIAAALAIAIGTMVLPPQGGLAQRARWVLGIGGVLLAALPLSYAGAVQVGGGAGWSMLLLPLTVAWGFAVTGSMGHQPGAKEDRAPLLLAGLCLVLALTLHLAAGAVMPPHLPEVRP